MQKNVEQRKVTLRRKEDLMQYTIRLTERYFASTENVS
jgi:hypothetical protein